MTWDQSYCPYQGSSHKNHHAQKSWVTSQDAHETLADEVCRWTLTWSIEDDLVHAPLTPTLHEAHEDEENDEVDMIVPGNTVANPGTMVVKGRDAFVTYWAMFRPQWLLHQACPTKLRAMQFFHSITRQIFSLQLYLCSVIFILPFSLNNADKSWEFFTGANLYNPWVREPTLEVGIPDRSTGHHNTCGMQWWHMWGNMYQPCVIHP